MKEFQNKIAVVTGAASGIGRAIARQCVQEGIKVILADIEETALTQTKIELESGGAAVLAVPTDVSQVGDLEALAERTLAEFGAVHLLFNNAGVGAGMTIWDSTLADWEWVMGVNLWGVIHGLRVFVPIMLEQDTECHIVNTSSLAGLSPYHPSAAYQVAKHGVVALSEQLYYSLGRRNAKINVSVLCAGWVKTRIMESERNRPIELQNPTLPSQVDPNTAGALQYLRQLVETGTPPEQVAAQIFDAIRDEKFYILTHPKYTPMIQARVDSIVQGLNPPALQA